MLETDYTTLEEKTFRVCEENNLEIDLELSRYPITVAIRPNLQARDQLRFDLEDKEVSTNFVNGEIRLIFGDELTMTVFNDFKIEDELLNRIKGMVKKLHYLYLQKYFKGKMNAREAANIGKSS